MHVQKEATIAVASLGRKSRFTCVVIVVLALLQASLAIYAPVANAHSWSEAVLHSFDLADGADPAGMIQGSDGNFYGTTFENGPTGLGTVFKLTASGTLTTLYAFGSLAGDGVAPSGGLIQGSDGNFYGTTAGGGANADAIGAGGTVFKITPSGVLTTLYSFCGQSHVTDGELYCTDGQNPSAGVIQGSDGNFYGTTSLGGANGSGNPPGKPTTSHDSFGGTAFKLTPSGTLTTLYSFCSQGGTACTDGSEPGGLIQGSDGNFYGTTLYGGANGSAAPSGGGTAFKLTPSGTRTTFHMFCSQGGINCTDGVAPASGLIQGSDGNFYGTTLGGGAGAGKDGGGNGADAGGTVFRLTPSGRLTTLRSFCGGSFPACTGGWNPSGVIQGSDGDLYGTTAFGGANESAPLAGTVFRLTSSGILTSLYSFCSVVSNQECSDGSSPSGVIQGSDGDLYGTTTGGGLGVGTVFELSPPPGPEHIKVIPPKLTLKAEPNATASASVTIQNMGTVPVTVNISDPKHAPPFSASGCGSSITIGAGDDYQVTITYSPTNSTTSKEKSDSITVKAISNDPNPKKLIDVKLKGEK
jgi:uncharacterized repeat protein (TIGR03803 family)